MEENHCACDGNEAAPQDLIHLKIGCVGSHAAAAPLHEVLHRSAAHLLEASADQRGQGNLVNQAEFPDESGGESHYGCIEFRLGKARQQRGIAKTRFVYFM
jgi:hypothetical protein